MSTEERESYSKEFKINAVRMIVQGGRKESEVTRDLDMQHNMLFLWKRKHIVDNKESFPGKGKLKSKDEYISQLERQVKRLTDERDILKKPQYILLRKSS